MTADAVAAAGALLPVPTHTGRLVGRRSFTVPNSSCVGKIKVFQVRSTLKSSLELPRSCHHVRHTRQMKERNVQDAPK